MKNFTEGLKMELTQALRCSCPFLGWGFRTVAFCEVDTGGILLMIQKCGIHQLR